MLDYRRDPAGNLAIHVNSKMISLFTGTCRDGIFPSDLSLRPATCFSSKDFGSSNLQQIKTSIPSKYSCYFVLFEWFLKPLFNFFQNMYC